MGTLNRFSRNQTLTTIWFGYGSTVSVLYWLRFVSKFSGMVLVWFRLRVVNDRIRAFEILLNYHTVLYPSGLVSLDTG